MKRIIISIITLLVIAGGIWAVLPDQQAQEAGHVAPTPAVVEPTYPTPPQVQPIVDRLGLDKNLVAKINITVPPDASGCSTSNLSTAIACTRGNYIIYPANLLLEVAGHPEILRDTQVEQDRSFGHEYMHYIWNTMSSQDKNALTGSIEMAYSMQPDKLNDRLSGYSLDAENRLSELHSFICTEMTDSEIPHPLIDHCRQYLPNRYWLPSYY